MRYRPSDIASIHVYTADTLREVSVIKLSGVAGVADMVACHDDRQLYMIDLSGAIWRVSAVNPTDYEKWITDESLSCEYFRSLSLDGLPSTQLPPPLFTTLSLRSRRLLVTSLMSHSLRQYSTVNKQLLRVIELPDSVETPTHAVETPRGTFVVSHGIMLESSGVSELFSFMIYLLVY